MKYYLKINDTEFSNCSALEVTCESRSESVKTTLSGKYLIDRIGSTKLSVSAKVNMLPESEMGCKLAQRLAHTNVVDFIGVSDEYSILEIHAPKSWVGRSLVQLDVRQKHKVNVLAVRHGEQGTLDASPKPDRAIEQDDLLFIMGENKFVSRVVELD